MKIDKKWLWLGLLAVLLGFFLTKNTSILAPKISNVALNQSYTSKEEVSLYIYKFGKLPQNFITKKEAFSLGWDPQIGNLQQVAPNKSIGGDRFTNREGKLPKKDGRKWFECDIDYNGGKRGPKRIVFSDDGLIYYTPDHYNSFYLLYERKQL